MIVSSVQIALHIPGNHDVHVPRKIRRLAKNPWKAAPDAVQERGRGRGRGGRGGPKGPGSRGGRGRGSSRGRGQTPAGSEPKEPASKKARTTKPEASQKKGGVSEPYHVVCVCVRACVCVCVCVCVYKRFAGTNPYLDITLEERARLSKLLPKLPRYRESQPQFRD